MFGRNFQKSVRREIEIDGKHAEGRAGAVDVLRADAGEGRGGLRSVAKRH